MLSSVHAWSTSQKIVLCMEAHVHPLSMCKSAAVHVLI